MNFSFIDKFNLRNTVISGSTKKSMDHVLYVYCIGNKDKPRENDLGSTAGKQFCRTLQQMLFL
jgi:hypothetical protein